MFLSLSALRSSVLFSRDKSINDETLSILAHLAQPWSHWPLCLCWCLLLRANFRLRLCPGQSSSMSGMAFTILSSVLHNKLPSPSHLWPVHSVAFRLNHIKLLIFVADVSAGFVLLKKWEFNAIQPYAVYIFLNRGIVDLGLPSGLAVKNLPATQDPRDM